MNNFLRILLLVLGTLFVALGSLGLFLPVLPTTPFLLLAAACYARGSVRLYNWLLTNRWFGHYIRNYREGKGISLRHKVTALLLLWVGIGSTVCFFIHYWWLKVMLLIIAAAVTLHIVRIKTYRPEENRSRIIL
ncbi:MAG TPA: YbaN family protein [bacterium]|nr:YbaN family protein [bacterium]HPN43747.1 YbaN family protein [bacterium]